MRYSKIIKSILTIAVALLISFEAHAASISVKVVNESTGGTLVDYPVTLVVGNMDSNGKFTQVRSTEARTDESGVASGAVETKVSAFIRAEIVYKGINYLSQTLSLRSSGKDLRLDVPVFEISNDSSSVLVDSRRMIVLTKNEGTLEVFETLIVSNTGRLTYVGQFNNERDLNQVLFIPMPASYMLYGFTGYEKPKIRTLGNGIVTQNEMIPGTKEISLHYYVQSDIGEFDLTLFSEKDAPEIMDFTMFFPAENAWKLKQSGLKNAGQEWINNIPYNIFKGNHGNVVKLKVFGPSYSGGLGLWHISIILAFVLAALSLYFTRENLRSWTLAREEQRLENLVEDLEEEFSDKGTKDQYTFVKQTINERIQSISEHFEQQ